MQHLNRKVIIHKSNVSVPQNLKQQINIQYALNSTMFHKPTEITNLKKDAEKRRLEIEGKT